MSEKRISQNQVIRRNYFSPKSNQQGLISLGTNKGETIKNKVIKPPLSKRQTSLSLTKLISKGDLWQAAKKKKHRNEKLKHNEEVQAAPFLNEIDHHLPTNGLAFGEIHEWSFEHTTNPEKNWLSPISILLHLLANSLHNTQNSEKRIIFIGQRCWPTSFTLSKYLGKRDCLQTNRGNSYKPNYNWLENCLFIDPPDKEKRLWSTAKALQNPAVLGVIADVSFANLTQTRRLKLAAKKANALGLLFRSPWEMKDRSTLKSAASSRWCIKPHPEGWEIKLEYAKGCRAPFEWILNEDFKTEKIQFSKNNPKILKA